MTGPRFTPQDLVLATRGRWSGVPPQIIEGISTDTRKPMRGACFVALEGERFDGHDFVGAAASAGAACAVVSQSEKRHPIPALVVPNTLAALGALARFHRRRFAIPVVAVTGSNGKTTTREMIASILAARAPVLKTESNLNNEVGVPLTLFGLDSNHTAAVIEMGMSNPGEIARLTAIVEPKVGVVTNATAAHLAGMGTVEAVADAKAELYAGLGEDGVAVVNGDDSRMVERARASGRQMVTFGVALRQEFSSGGDVVVLDILSHDISGLAILLGVGGRTIEVSAPLVGIHNAANMAAAVAAAVAVGATDREIVAGFRAVRPVGRRLRLVRLASGLYLIDDCYNANPASMSAALATLGQLAAASPGSRPVAVLGDMLELGPVENEAHRALGAEAARRGVALLATFGPRSRETAAAARAGGIPESAIFHTEKMEALTTWARQQLTGHDTLLVKASRGMKLERLVEALS
jgi:UDP-N-acetylmuramoyl-tripeptide--D-alanyl-D-alanine ligase